MQWLLKLFNTIHTPRETHPVLQMHFADAICANAICAIAKLKTIKNLFNNNLILLYIIIYNNINIIIYLNEYIFDFQIAQLHNCTIAQLLECTIAWTLSKAHGVRSAESTRGQECCAYYFDYPFATLQLATLQLAKRLVWMIMDELGWVKMSWDEVSWRKVVIL